VPATDTLSSTLGGDAALASRHAAYLERKSKRKASRGMSGKGSVNSSSILHADGFLSNLPEIDADIEYRFAVVVMGQEADNIVADACRSQSARDFPKAPSEEVSAPEKGGRCLSTVPFPLSTATAASRVKLAKLIFRVSTEWSDIPVCSNRFEALSSVLIFVLHVNPMEGQSCFQEQLLHYEHASDEMRWQHRRLRASRAILLIRAPTGAASDAEDNPEQEDIEDESWKGQLNEYELIHGALWKFGPVDLDDANGIYAVFATIASSRILRSQRSEGADSDGSHLSDLPPVYEAEREENELGCSSTEVSQTSAAEGPFRHPWLSPVEKGAA